MSIIKHFYELEQLVKTYYVNRLMDLFNDEIDFDEFMDTMVSNGCEWNGGGPRATHLYLCEEIFNQDFVDTFGLYMADLYNSNKKIVSPYLMCEMVQRLDLWYSEEFGDRMFNNKMNGFDVFNLYAYKYMMYDYDYRQMDMTIKGDYKLTKKIRTFTFIFTSEFTKRVDDGNVKIQDMYYLIQVKSIIKTLFGLGLITDLIIDYCKT